MATTYDYVMAVWLRIELPQVSADFEDELNEYLLEAGFQVNELKIIEDDDYADTPARHCLICRSGGRRQPALAGLPVCHQLERLSCFFHRVFCGFYACCPAAVPARDGVGWPFQQTGGGALAHFAKKAGQSLELVVFGSETGAMSRL